MGYQMVTWTMTSRDPQKCCEEVRSAILATAWLRVMFTDAGAHFMQYTQHAIALSEYRLQTDELTQYIHFTDYWCMRLAISEKHWNCTAHFRYRGSIEYRDTWDGIVIVAPISGIAQHYATVLCWLRDLMMMMMIMPLTSVINYVCHFLLVVLWNRASIYIGFWSYWTLSILQYPSRTRKPSCCWQIRATRKHAKNCSSALRRAYNVVADDTGLSSFV